MMEYEKQLNPLAILSQTYTFDIPTPRRAISIFIWQFLGMLFLIGSLNFVLVHVAGSRDTTCFVRLVVPIVMIFLLIRKLKNKGYNIPFILRINPLSKNIIAPLSIMAFALILLLVVAETWFPKVLIVTHSNDLARSESNPILPLWAEFITLATSIITVPLWEEIMLRGLLLTSFQRTFGIRRAILFSSLIFGILHLFLIHHAIITTLNGMILAWIVYKTQTILSALLFHFAYNATVDIGPLFYSKLFNGELFVSHPFVSVIIACVGALLLCVGYFWLKANLNIFPIPGYEDSAVTFKDGHD